MQALTFQEKPDYDFLEKLFKEVLLINCSKPYSFDWNLKERMDENREDRSIATNSNKLDDSLFMNEEKSDNESETSQMSENGGEIDDLLNI